MAVKANVLLKTIGEKMGLTADQITKLTGNASLATIDIEDEIATQISNAEIFTADSAVSNSKIRGKIRAEVLDGADADIERIALKHGFSSEDVAELKKLDKTSARLEKYSEKLAELKEKAASTSGKAKNELEKEIEKLNSQVASVRTEFETKLAAKEAEMASRHIDWEISSRYNALDYALPEGVDKKTFSVGAKAILDSKLTEKGIKFKLTEKGLEPFNVKEDTRYFDSKNQPISADDLIKSIAMEAKILKTSGQQTQKKVTTHQQSNVDKPELVISNKFGERLNDSVERFNENVN